MLNPIVALLLGLVKRAADQVAPGLLGIDIRVFARLILGGFKPGVTFDNCGWSNLPAVDGTLACQEFGLTPIVVEVSLTGLLPLAKVEEILGCSVWEEGPTGPRMTPVARAHVKKVGKGAYRFMNPHIFMDMKILARAIWALMPPGINMDRVIPGPLRLLDTKSGSICIMLSAPKTPTFRERCKELGLNYRKVARRFPKDAWNTPIGPRRRVRLLVTAKREDGSHDGDFFLKSSVAFAPLCLYRGMGKLGRNKTFLVKGRGIVADDLVPGDVDGITTQDNVKWTNVEPGTVVELDLIPATDESGHAKDGGYGWHSMAMLFMASKAAQLGSMRRRFAGWAQQLADKWARFISKEGLQDTLRELATHAEESEFAVVNSDRSKHVLGLSSSAERESMWVSYFQKVVTSKTGVSKYPAIIFSTEWCGKEVKPGRPLYNGAMAEWLEANQLFNKDLTMLRYPVASKGSYLRIRLLKGNRINMVDSEPLIVAHPRCAKHLQGDGDDHVLVTADWVSEFDPEQEPAQARAYEQREAGSVLESLLQVWQASNGIGLIFNAMAKSVGAMRALGHTEGEIESEMNWFGSQLDLYAQAVKKPFVLTPPGEIASRASKWVERVEDAKLEDNEHFQLGMLVGCNLRKENAWAAFAHHVRAFYGVRLPFVPDAADVPVEGLRPVIGNKAIVAKFTRMAAGVTIIWKAMDWHKQLVTALLGESGWEGKTPQEVGEAVDTYAAIAIALRKTGEDLCLEQMNGNWIAASQCVGTGYLV